MNTLPIYPAFIGAIIKQDKRTLIFYHNKFKLYIIPVGKIDKDESPYDTLLREMQEELAIEVLQAKIVFTGLVDNRLYNIPGMSHATVYEITEYNGKITNAEPHKHNELLWLSNQQLEVYGKLYPVDELTLNLLTMGLL